MLKFLALLVFEVPYLLGCSDGHGNVIRVFRDCSKAGSKIRISDVQISSYDYWRRQPQCCSGRARSKSRSSGGGFMAIPGYTKVTGGRVRVAGDFAVSSVRVRVSAAKYASPRSHRYRVFCNNGRSVRADVPNRFCTFPLCETVGAERCLEMQQKHKIDLSDILQTGYTFPTSITYARILAGDWRLRFQMVTADDRKIGCVEAKRLPFRRKGYNQNC